MIFIIREIQALKGECYNTEDVHLNFITSRQPPRRRGARCAPTEPPHPYAVTPLR
jgi:hypothetical protein